RTPGKVQQELSRVTRKTKPEGGTKCEHNKTGNTFHGRWPQHCCWQQRGHWRGKTCGTTLCREQISRNIERINGWTSVVVTRTRLWTRKLSRLWTHNWRRK